MSMSVTELRLLYSYLHAKGEAEIRDDRYRIFDTSILVNNTPMVDMQTPHECDCASSLDVFLGTFRKQSDIPAQLLTVAMYSIFNGVTSLVDGYMLTCEYVNLIDVLNMRFLTSAGNEIMVFYLVGSETLYIKSANETQITYMLSSLWKLNEDKRYKEIDIKLHAIPAMLPVATPTECEDIAYVAWNNTVRIKRRDGEVRFLPWSLKNTVVVATQYWHYLYRIIHNLTVTEVTGQEKNWIIQRLYDEDKANGRKNLLNTESFYAGYSTDKVGEMHRVCVLTHYNYVVIAGSSLSNMKELTGAMSGAEPSLAYYLSRNCIEDVPKEIFRLLRLAGIDDAEERVAKVLKEIDQCDG